MLIAGVDEAGRGPVIGPMVFSVVVIDDKDDNILTELGITDSKLIEKETRESLFKEIQKISIEHQILSLSAAEITEWMNSASLNEIEAIKTAEMLNSLKVVPDVCYVDCPDVVPDRYSNNIQHVCKKETKIIAEHKADLKYKVAGAASILAKVTRDQTSKELSKVHGNLGSGYPGDPLTQEWLNNHWEKNRNFPDIVRKKWATVDRKAQLRLTDW